MKLNNEQRKIVEEKLSDVLKRKCIVCTKGDHWLLNPVIFELREFNGGSLSLGGSVVNPVITLTCKNCGHTYLFNAVRLGIIENKKKQDDKEK